VVEKCNGIGFGGKTPKPRQRRRENKVSILIRFDVQKWDYGVNDSLEIE
jgi:hypothetical protein